MSNSTEKQLSYHTKTGTEGRWAYRTTLLILSRIGEHHEHIIWTKKVGGKNRENESHTIRDTEGNGQSVKGKNRYAERGAYERVIIKNGHNWSHGSGKLGTRNTLATPRADLLSMFACHMVSVTSKHGKMIRDLVWMLLFERARSKDGPWPPLRSSVPNYKIH